MSISNNSNSIKISTLLCHLIQWSSEEVYFLGNDFFSELITNLNNSKNSIEFECYIFYHDNLGRKIIHALISAAKRGVKIKLILDGYGSMSWNRHQVDELTNVGIEVKIFHPLPWRLSLYNRTIVTTNFINKFLYLVSRINKRNHRKLYIIDSETAWSGSMNISVSHLNHNNHDNIWLDCGVKITGKPVIELSNSFHEIWKRKIHYPVKNTHLPFRTNNNIIKRQHKNNELIELIQSCKQKIWIINAYLAPSRRILNALKRARSNGADVKLIISHHSDVIFFPLISTTYYTELLQIGVEIYEHNQYIIHAKTILLDGIAFVGSSNLNHRSFLHDYELDIILRKPDTLHKLTEQFIQLATESDKINASKIKDLPWHYHIIGKIFWAIRYWL
jgi:cardiolipin synthase A/B